MEKCKYTRLENSTDKINQTEWKSECGLHVCIPEGYKYIKTDRGMYKTDVLRLPSEERCMKCRKEIEIIEEVLK